MSITSELIRGHTDTVILARLLDGDSYGYEINKAIREKTGGEYELKEATLYGAFRRLEEQGCIVSYWGGEATGARRRYYRITAEGREVYRQNSGEWESAKKLLDALILKTEARQSLEENHGADNTRIMIPGDTERGGE